MSSVNLMKNFIVARLEEAPLKERARLYHSLAEVADSPAENQQLQALAHDIDRIVAQLEVIELKHRKFVLEFYPNVNGHTGGNGTKG